MKVGIIADDLTGANATGVRLSENGFHPATYFHYNDLLNDENTDVIVIDTDSRYASERVLDHRVGGSLTKLKHWGADILAKRVDSTLRGNVGKEIDMILETVGEETIGVVVPSFPDSGRITVGGYLIVDSLPLHRTDAANDPITPITSSYVPEIISAQTEHQVGVMTINDMSEDCETFLESFKSVIEKGNKIVVLDAVTNNDIEFIAEALSQYKGHKLVPIDPGPFTSLYAKYRANQIGDDRKIIVTVGSATKVSEKQLVYLIDRLKIKPVIPDITKLATFDHNWHDEVQKCVKKAKKRMEDNEVTVITTNKENLVIIDIKK
ncbi:four-carbon acid sugar kinase family protein [Jeotgalicoccus sp. ATCC 8456]|uniref:four-carbon acid sugar kinase family protein n=2 Tax=Jeotgalicoccus TaxID=227979 RepID=UPI0018E60293|nr:four-carbon acid sugar kinase family protein [Jeotgalicoccus sp. ATCC 8456]QQD84181.1 four-carbon acid sugar kinase family protein [Jeotgalicoccus sp. ATCC 8456]